MKTYHFPKDFVWGTATAAHQVEGNNTLSDWWHWEQSKTSDQKYPYEPSGIACDSYNRYEEDFSLCRDLNNNAVRISIEWARIETQESQFDASAFEHYRAVLKAAKEKGLQTYVTLHHFTSPKWFTDKGGWHSLQAPTSFAKYTERCVNELDEYIDSYITINEPQVYALMSYTVGIWPPAKKNYFLSLLTQINMIRSHRKAYNIIKKNSSKPVGIAKNIVWYETHPYEASLLDKVSAGVLNLLNDNLFLLPIAKKLDFIGLNYYFTNRVKNFRFVNPTDYVSDLGWWINPGGLGNILQKLKKYKLPIYITENGLADKEDRYRSHFIEDMIISCGAALEDGVNLKGYFHWSLIDNYEWHEGFWPRFGLVEIDRDKELERKPRQSFYFYSDICKNNKIDVQD